MRLFIDVNGEPRLLLRSIEGTAAENWPASGALQEVLPQPHELGECLTAVGRAGKSHWSVVVAPCPGSAGFEFDFACRMKEAANWLGSTYQTQGPETAGLDLVRGDTNQCVYDVPDTSAQLTCHASPGTELETTSEQLRIAPVSNDVDDALPRTVRWAYRFELST